MFHLPHESKLDRKRQGDGVALGTANRVASGETTPSWAGVDRDLGERSTGSADCKRNYNDLDGDGMDEDMAPMLGFGYTDYTTTSFATARHYPDGSTMHFDGGPAGVGHGIEAHGGAVVDGRDGAPSGAEYISWEDPEVMIQEAQREVETAKSQVKIYQNRGTDESWNWRLSNLTDEQLERELELLQRAKEMERSGAAFGRESISREMKA
eukprot:m.155993 g.155993  ORF g.155993 m.155993 type:complete len:210 (-) comp23601_c0_seq1:200-829(-)